MRHGVLALLALFLFAAPVHSEPFEPSLTTEAPGLFQLQFEGPIDAALRESLYEKGLRVVQMMPPDGLLVEATTGTLPKLPTGIRPRAWTLGEKLGERLVDIVSGQSAPGGPISLQVATLRGRSTQGIAGMVRPLLPPLGTLHTAEGGSGRGTLWMRVPEPDLKAVILSLAQHPDVLRVERFVLPVLLNNDSTWLLQSGSVDLGRTVWQQGLTGIGQIVGVADSGLDADACQFRYGASRDQVTLAISDPQPPEAIESNPENKVITYYVIGAAEAYDDATGGFHGTHTVGDMAGDNYATPTTAAGVGHDDHDGMAPGAQVVFQDLGANEGTLIGLNGVTMYDLLDQAYRTGARIHNNSYGSPLVNINYDISSQGIDAFTWKNNDMLVVFAAGNSGSDYNGNIKPASLSGGGSTAKNTLVVGASGPVELDLFGTHYELENDLLFFSSQGPTKDNRIKPEVLAPGLVFSATTDSGTLINLGCCDATGQDRDIMTTNNDDNNCNVDSDWPTMGTSFSSPLTAGAAALVRQYYTDGYWARGKAEAEAGFNPTNALLKATIINGAQALSGVIMGMGTTTPLTPPPSFEQGWGRVNLEECLSFEGERRHTLILADVPNPVPGNPMLLPEAELAPFSGDSEALLTADQVSWMLPAMRPDGLLKITLVWSDPPAGFGVKFALINNLDLEVISPKGELYLGNMETDDSGLSQPSDTGQRDALNNVEHVSIANPGTGSYRVRVSAAKVDGNGEEGSTSQGYGLVVSGEFLAPTALNISPNRGAPGATLTNVVVVGEHFAEGMDLDLGEGITVSGIEVIDAGSARIDSLKIQANAKLGPRAGVTTLLQSLSATSPDLFVVDNASDGGGCSCGTSQSGGFLIFLLMPLLLIRRRRGRD